MVIPACCDQEKHFKRRPLVGLTPTGLDFYTFRSKIYNQSIAFAGKVMVIETVRSLILSYWQIIFDRLKSLQVDRNSTVTLPNKNLQTL